MMQFVDDLPKKGAGLRRSGPDPAWIEMRDQLKTHSTTLVTRIQRPLNDNEGWARILENVKLDTKTLDTMAGLKELGCEVKTRGVGEEMNADGKKSRQVTVFARVVVPFVESASAPVPERKK